MSKNQPSWSTSQRLRNPILKIRTTTVGMQVSPFLKIPSSKDILVTSLHSENTADVVQATNYGILTSAADVKLPRLAKFSALIAAAVHDVGHIGNQRQPYR